MLSKVKSMFVGAVSAGLLLTGSAIAQQAEPALWSISDEDSTVYLFGSFHLLPSDVDWQSHDFKAAFDDAESIIFETDTFSAEAQQSMQPMVAALGFNEPGVTLSSLLDAETHATLAEVAPTLGVPVQALEPLKPWLATVMMGVQVISAQGFDPAQGVEQVVYRQGSEAGKQFAFLETPREQLGFFADLPMDVQVEMFSNTIHEIQDLPNSLDVMLQAWAQGNTDHLGALLNEEMQNEAPEVFEALFVHRNQNWIVPILEALGGTDDVLVIVGAGHMPGEQGVISLLEQEGVEVRRH